MKILIVFAILMVILAGISFYLNSNPDININILQQNKTVALKNKTFTVDLAKTLKEQEIGLSGRPSLPEDHGMLFIFDKPSYQSFWMRNMKFPIDIIFIRNKKIVTIFSNVQQPSKQNEVLPVYVPEEPADSVLEINAGLSEKYSIKKGDSITTSL